MHSFKREQTVNDWMESSLVPATLSPEAFHIIKPIKIFIYHSFSVCLFDANTV